MAELLRTLKVTKTIATLLQINKYVFLFSFLVLFAIYLFVCLFFVIVVVVQMYKLCTICIMDNHSQSKYF